MKILFDYQAFYMQNFGGVSNGIVQTLSNMSSDVKIEIAIKESNNEHLRKSGLATFSPAINTSDHFITDCPFRGKQRLYDFWTAIHPQKTSLGRNQAYAIERIVAGDFDVFHPTFFDGYFLPYLNGRPFVLTIHDMIPEILRIKDGQIEKKRKLVDRATHIVAVSENTKVDIINLLNVPESKITVIYWGAPKQIVPDVSPLIKGRYILFVGLRASYKYFIPTVRSLLPVIDRHPDINIVCTGPDFSNSERDFFSRHQITERMIHIRPSDVEMVNLYSNALCFVYPSLYEGFGIPILEAYQANCPVILNNKSCFPEIAKDAALFFDSDDVSSSLEEVMESFLKMSKGEKEILLKKQRCRLDFFSWKKTAMQYQELYESLL